MATDDNEIVKWPLDRDFLQNNIDRSIDFRKEYYKYTLAISTALLAFTISFPPNLEKVAYQPLIFFSWAGLGLAVVAGVMAHYFWADFFIAWRDYDNKGNKERGQEVRRTITMRRRLADKVQFIGLALGVGCIVVFTGINYANIATKAADQGNAGIDTVTSPTQ